MPIRHWSEFTRAANQVANKVGEYNPDNYDWRPDGGGMVPNGGPLLPRSPKPATAPGTDQAISMMRKYGDASSAGTLAGVKPRQQYGGKVF
jgi:hypothetical protein